MRPLSLSRPAVGVTLFYLLVPGPGARARPTPVAAPAFSLQSSALPSKSVNASMLPGSNPASLAWCYDVNALYSIEGQGRNPFEISDFDGVLEDYSIYIGTSIALAFVIILIMIVAVCLRDRHAGKHKKDEEDVPLTLLSTATLEHHTQRDAPRDAPRSRFLRAPRRISRVLRRRRGARAPSAARRISLEEPPHAPEPAPSAAAPALPTEATPAAPIGTELAELGLDAPPAHRAPAPLTLTIPEPPASAMPHTGSDVSVPVSVPDQSDVDAVNALPIEPEVAQPPAYIATPEHERPAPPLAGPSKAPHAPPLEEVGGTDELFAHVATDDKAVLTALRSAASAPGDTPSDPLGAAAARTVDAAPSALPGLPQLGAVVPSAPPMDPLPESAEHGSVAPPRTAQAPMERHSDASPPGKGKARHTSAALGAPAAPIGAPGLSYLAPSYESGSSHAAQPSASSKEAEAEAERASLAALLPSAPHDWAWSRDALPQYGATPSAPPDEYAAPSAPAALPDEYAAPSAPSALLGEHAAPSAPPNERSMPPTLPDEHAVPSDDPWPLAHPHAIGDADERALSHPTISAPALGAEARHVPMDEPGTSGTRAYADEASAVPVSAPATARPESLTGSRRRFPAPSAPPMPSTETSLPVPHMISTASAPPLESVGPSIDASTEPASSASSKRSASPGAGAERAASPAHTPPP
ncbi:hypothetical protein MOBT1_002106 [Malassezia obtusa]|uniref:Uncharacterized protein n=1 Tax=Malassezia obtusa TaxID=76774 RepID=A0AAF0E4L1_9BASI|nr:hypothetical protein MOBT1_002106 [Malassezia obtusa]